MIAINLNYSFGFNNFADAMK